jgi:hypothetical protein
MVEIQEGKSLAIALRGLFKQTLALPEVKTALR